MIHKISESGNYKIYRDNDNEVVIKSIRSEKLMKLFNDCNDDEKHRFITWLLKGQIYVDK